MTARVPLLSAHAVLIVSGLSGLGCQVLWSRMFALGLGQELPALLAVVAAFFGGLALGAAGSDALHRHWPGTSLQLYACLEALIGLWVWLSPALIPAANAAALAWIGLEPPFWRHALVAFAAPALTLLPATAAMGATLVAMEGFVRQLATQGRVVGTLYAANTLGAAVGAAVTLEAGFQLGFTATLRGLGLLNLACAAAAWGLGRACPAPAPPRADAAARPGATAFHLSPGRLRGLLLVTGGLGIGLEVLGVRVLKLVLEDTGYTFAALLAVYLAGTALGAATVRRLAKRWPAWGDPAMLLLGLAGACALSGWTLAVAPEVYALLRRGLGHTFAAVTAAELLVAVSVFLPASLGMGATFATLAQHARDAGFGLGRALAWNTLGGTLAPLGVGALAYPALGGQGTLAGLVAGYVLLALSLDRRWRRVALVAPLALAVATLPDLRLIRLLPGERLRVWREGVSDSVAVIETETGDRTLRVNHRFTMGGTAAAVAERRQAHLPLLLHPAPRRALFLGAGTGITAAAATAHPGVQVDCVELLPEVVAVMPEFAPANAAPPERWRVFTADARRFLRATPHRYDVIVADLFHPARDGAGALFTREHYRAARARLAPGGLLCQWVPLYQFTADNVGRVLASLRAEFPVVQAFLLRPVLETPVLGLVAFTQPRSYPVDWFERRVTSPALREALRAVGLYDLVQLLGCYWASGGGLAGEPDTDDRQRIHWRAARDPGLGQRPPWARLWALRAWAAAGPGPEGLLDAPEGLGPRLRAFTRARDQYLEALRAEAEGRWAEARWALVECVRQSADFTAGYAHALTLAVQMSADNPAEARRLLAELAAARPERPVAGELLRRLFPVAPTAPFKP